MSSGEITRWLAAMKDGDPQAESKLMGVVYDELHALARRYMRREHRNYSGSYRQCPAPNCVCAA